MLLDMAEKGKDEVFYISEAEFWSEIKDDYVQKIAEMDPNEVEAVTCQKSSTDEEMEAGACGDQLIAFMECAMRTQCFKTLSKDEGSSS